MDGIALKPLTVSFSEPGFLSKANQENQFGPWFTLSDQERQQLGSPMGPVNPQALNRYAYVMGNPLKYTDPSGHTWYLSQIEAADLAISLRDLASELRTYTDPAVALSIMSEAIAVFTVMMRKAYAADYLLSKVILPPSAAVTKFFGVAGLFLFSIEKAVEHAASQIDELARMIELANRRGNGVILETIDGVLYAADRRTGEQWVLDTPFWLDNTLPTSLNRGETLGNPSS
jgi:hypothetical protein